MHTDDTHNDRRPTKGWWLRAVGAPLAIGLLGTLALLPIDGALSGAARELGSHLGGDIRRALLTLQQFGDLLTVGIGIAIIASLQPARLRRTLDWLLAAGFGLALFNAIKLATGRLRPDWAANAGPDQFRWFAWASEMAAADSRTFAFPSTHTTHAFIAAVFLAAMYPRLRALVFSWAAVVGMCRVMFGGHWPSDVFAGAALGYAWARLVVDRYWGVRLIDLLWRMLVDRNATPALARVRHHENALIDQDHDGHNARMD